MNKENNKLYHALSRDNSCAKVWDELNKSNNKPIGKKEKTDEPSYRELIMIDYFVKANSAALTRKYGNNFIAVAGELVIDSDESSYMLYERINHEGFSKDKPFVITTIRESVKRVNCIEGVLAGLEAGGLVVS